MKDLKSDRIRIVMDQRFKYKVLIIGDSSVGKTSLLLRHADGRFTETVGGTIGIDYRCKTYVRDGVLYELQIWDTAGQERFRNVTKSYFRDAHGALIVFDVANQSTFDHVPDWLQTLYAESGKDKEDIVTILVGNKSDLKSVVPYDSILDLAGRLNLSTFVQTSAKDNSKVDELFGHLLDKIIARNPAVKPDNKLTSGGTDKGSCCT